MGFMESTTWVKETLAHNAFAVLKNLQKVKKGQQEKILLEAFSSSSFSSLVTFFNPKKKILKSRPIFDIYQGQYLVSPTFPSRVFFSNDGFFTEVFDPFSLILPMRCSKDKF